MPRVIIKHVPTMACNVERAKKRGNKTVGL